MNQQQLEEKIRKFFSFLLRNPEEIRFIFEENENLVKVSIYHPLGDSLTKKDDDLLKASEIILTRILASEIENKRIYLDINNFRKNKEEKLIELIKKIARQCSYKKESFTFPPMNAYQRRLVHTEVAKYPDLTTESSGEEPERRVTIKPI